MSIDTQITQLNKEKEYNFLGYILFWFGQLQSHLGSNIVQFVILVWIAWEFESPLLLGIAAFAGFAPIIVITPLAGVFVDRWSRKKVIILVDFLQAFATFILVALFYLGDVIVWYVIIISAFRGIFEAFHYPATEAIMPLMVPPEKLGRMNGLSYLSYGIIGILGPLIAALLLLYWKIFEILLLDPITFIFAIVPVLLVKIPEVKEKKQLQDQKPSIMSEFSEGISFIRHKDGLLPLLSIFTGANFFIPFLMVLLPLFVKISHSGEKGDLAFIFALNQLGLLIGALIMSSWKGFQNKIVGVVFGILFMYVGVLIVVFTPTGPNTFLIMGFGMALVGFMLPVANISSQTIWQTVVPPEKIGRVFSVRRSIAQFSAPLAMIMSGVLAEFIAMETLFFACAALGLVCLAYTWFMTNLSAVEVESVMPTESPITA